MEFKTNIIYCGDCKNILTQFPEGAIDLIYVDPPFFSNRQYEVLWGDGYELRAFEDRWRGGVENYIAWMEDKIRECHKVLKDTGSMYLHCDWHANAHLRILMDNVFGENNFRNEIIWHYGQRTMHNAKKFNAKHDTIFFYAKSNKTKIKNQITIPWVKEEIVKRRARKIEIDTDGREYIWDNRSVSKGYPPKKQYIEDIIKKGKAIDDVWDIPIILSTAKERLGYPTQKPEALLEQIIKASSNQDDVVLDPMCGCGTAIAVAQKLRRQWIGIDVSPTASKLMVNRMRSLGVSIGDNDIIGLPRTLEEVKAMLPFEFQNWVCEKLFARASRKMVGDFGIDGWLLDGRPLQVKQSENVGRNIIDNFETAIRRAKRNRGIVVAFSFGKGAYEEVARVKLHEDLNIELKTVEKILREE